MAWERKSLTVGFKCTPTLKADLQRAADYRGMSSSRLAGTCVEALVRRICAKIDEEESNHERTAN
jgi:hypothetical protein